MVYGFVLHEGHLEVEYDGSSDTHFSLDNVYWKSSPIFDLPNSVNNLGTYLGSPLPSTSYWVTLSIEGKIIFKGNVLVVKNY